MDPVRHRAALQSCPVPENIEGYIAAVLVNAEIFAVAQQPNCNFGSIPGIVKQFHCEQPSLFRMPESAGLFPG